MIRTIATHELRDVIRDGRFRCATAFTIGLLVVALVTAATYRQEVAAEHESAARFSRDSWLAQPSKDPHTAAHYGAYAFKPRGPLTLFDAGVNQFAGVAVWLEAHKQNEFQFRPAQDRSSVSRLGQLTAAATLQYLMPLLIILLAYTKFAGDREDGTLRQILAAGVESWRLAIGKALGVATALGIVLIPAAVLGSLALALSAGQDAILEVATRVAALTATYGAYFGAFIALALAVSAGARRSSHALAVLVTFWFLNAVIVPRAAVDLSRRVYPTATAFEFADRVHADTYDGLSVHDYNVKRSGELRERLVREHGVARVQDLPVNFRGIDYLEREAHSNAVWDRHYSTLWRSFEGQARIHDLAGWVSPLMAVRSVSMAVAGVDFFHHRDFAAAAESYRRGLVLAMNRQLAFGGDSQRMGAYAADASYWATVGPFMYQQPDVAWAAANAPHGLMALLGWLCVGVCALWWGVGRLGVD
jgi:ABC-2 type transport system permease protein